tara:strand:+ start:1979 stop:2587 length:609 start_codon:yes stop_codon:yes gene_type:complete
MRLILASSSKTRKTLLSRICGDTFEILHPNIDETQKNQEDPGELSKRLSAEKAFKIAKSNNDAVVIGSDQVAFCDGKILGKTNTLDDAFNQITWQVGKETKFFTGLALVRNGGQEIQNTVVISQVFYRGNDFIDENLIRSYLQKENPLNCAGSTKFEGQGICFLEKIETQDPSALMGLPLITLCTFFRKWDIPPFSKLETFS